MSLDYFELPSRRPITDDVELAEEDDERRSRDDVQTLARREFSSSALVDQEINFEVSSERNRLRFPCPETAKRWRRIGRWIEHPISELPEERGVRILTLLRSRLP